MKKYNISKPEKYMKDGVERTFWANIGTMTEFEKQDGTVSRIIEIPAISLKASIFLVEPKERTEKTPEQEVKDHERELEKQAPAEYEVDGVKVNSNDIPF